MKLLIRVVASPLIALICLSPAPASAQESKSASLAKQLAAALDQAKLDSIAAKDPSAPDAFAAALYFPGLQLLVISGKYSVPQLLTERVGRKEYRDVYLDLNGASIADTKIFIEDPGADGIKAKREENQAFDQWEMGGKRTMFNGDWKTQKMSEQDYLKAYTTADDRYSQILSALIEQAKKNVVARRMRGVHGLHHITAIAGPAQENLDFYAGVLGMRLVKRSVNQDDPGTYHLFYADAEGHPGSDLTFFPWAEMAPARPGHGLAMEVGLEVPEGSLGYWAERLQRYGAPPGPAEKRFGEQVLPFADPHGLRVALVERTAGRPFTPWEGSPVPSDRQVRGLHGAQLWERDATSTGRFLTTVLGFQQLATENEWVRYGFPDAAGVVDLRNAADARRGGWGIGSVHHLAWRVDDEAHQAEERRRIEAAGAQPTPVIDRFWFKSVYFKEPGGVLFELATDGPGFSVDEDPAHLGETLVLPPWLEAQRADIARALPPLSFATPAHARS